ncbi:MAG: AAA family ATPase, partial [Desulfovibrio sp.]|nr:AAA family ATPase [Desulfovibrio sp.]
MNTPSLGAEYHSFKENCDAWNDMPMETANPSPAGQKNAAGQDGEENKFVFHSLSEVEAAALPKWLVKNIIVDGAVGQVYGESGAGKSFWCLDLGMHVAHGWTWYGHKTVKRPVRFLVLEGSQGFLLRLRAYKQWARIFGNTPSQKLDGDFEFYVGDLSLKDEAEIKLLAETVPHGALVFIDTQAQATVGLQENTSDLGVAIHNAQKLATLAQCSVVLIHHKGKNLTAGGRGWSGQVAAWDFEIELTGKGRSVREWKVTKSKDGPEGETHGYSLSLIHIEDDEHKPM